MQDHIQLGLDYLQGWRWYNLSQQPFSIFNHYNSIFFMIDLNFLEFMPIYSCNVTGRDQEQFVFISFSPTYQKFVGIFSISLSVSLAWILWGVWKGFRGFSFHCLVRFLCVVCVWKWFVGFIPHVDYSCIRMKVTWGQKINSETAL